MICLTNVRACTLYMIYVNSGWLFGRPYPQIWCKCRYCAGAHSIRGGRRQGNHIGHGDPQPPSRTTAAALSQPPHHTIPHFSVPYHTTPYHTTPYYTTQHHITPYHTTPHYTTPHYTIPILRPTLHPYLNQIYHNLSCHHCSSPIGVS